MWARPRELQTLHFIILELFIYYYFGVSRFVHCNRLKLRKSSLDFGSLESCSRSMHYNFFKMNFVFLWYMMNDREASISHGRLYLSILVPFPILLTLCS